MKPLDKKQVKEDLEFFSKELRDAYKHLSYIQVRINEIYEELGIKN